MNISYQMETVLSASVILLSSTGLILLIKINWRQYGKLFIISGGIAVILCLLFVEMGFYSYPHRLIPQLSPMPFFETLTGFSFLVLFGVRYSPRLWIWKIPFYWVIVHLGMLVETWAQKFTNIIKYDKFWDVWDSYTWWWIYLLIFESIGGILIAEEYRKPMNIETLKYGKIGWFLLHFILIGTVFLGGFYLGRVL